MNKHRYNKLALAIVWGSIFVFCCSIVAFAQEKQKIPAGFFSDKRVGLLTGYFIYDEDGTGCRHKIKKIQLSIEVSNQDAILHPFGLKGSFGIMPASNKLPGHTVMMKRKPHYEEALIQAVFDIGDKGVPGHLLGLVAVLATELLDNYVDLKDSSIFVNHSREEKCNCGTVTGKVVLNGRIYNVLKHIIVFPKDIKPSEPIKTDKKTQLEITMPDIGKVNIAPNTEAKINCSVCWLQVDKGKIHGLIKKLKPKTKFDIKTPTTAFTIRGTEYTVEVEDDGTTTVVVLDGEVEVSDKENKKTVIVKKNQKSIVKPGALPIEPEEIDPEKFLNWWE